MALWIRKLSLARVSPMPERLAKESTYDFTIETQRHREILILLSDIPY